MFKIRAELDWDSINTWPRFSRVTLGNVLNPDVFKNFSVGWLEKGKYGTVKARKILRDKRHEIK